MCIICFVLFDCDHKRRQLTELTVPSDQSSLIEYKLAATSQTWKQPNLLLIANFSCQYWARKGAQRPLGVFQEIHQNWQIQLLAEKMRIKSEAKRHQVTGAAGVSSIKNLSLAGR